MDFHILGLPRSRTAWLANYLTTDTSMCYHEGIQYCDCWEDYTGLGETFDGIVGNADTGIYLLRDWKPTGKLVIIERNPADVMKSLKVLVDDACIHTVATSCIKLKALAEVADLVVPYAELDQYLDQISELCIGQVINSERKLLLQNLNIQIHELTLSEANTKFILSQVQEN
jgi:hypothetical protein